MRHAFPPVRGLGFALVIAIAAAMPAVAHEDHPSKDIISGPETVIESTSFQLCTTWNKRANYLWRGEGITGDSTGSCVSISGLAPGTYVYTLKTNLDNDRNEHGRFGWKGNGNGGTTTAMQTVTVIDADSVCAITGPTLVAPCTDVELCAPDFDGVSFHWTGDNISRWDGDRRCITVRGLTPGTHVFTLDLGGLGAPFSCTHTVVVGASDACLITGPARVARNTSFELCGPDGVEGTWLWEGKAIPSGTSTRCVTIPGLRPGRYDYTLQLTRDASIEVCTFAVTVVDSTANCIITGESEVFAHEPLELCGPEGDYTYLWSGKGIATGTNTRCITVADPKPGNYSYTLHLTGATGTESCSFAVRVTDSTAISVCPQPLGYWRQDCGTFTRDGFLTDADLSTIAGCVDERSSIVDWADDLAGFNMILDGKVGHGSSQTLLQQYIVLLANVCAADLGLTNATEDSIGLRLDTVVSCGGDTTTIAQLIASTETLLSSDRARGYRGDNTRCLPAFSCLARINAGEGDEFACSTARRAARGRHGWDHDRFHFDAATPGTVALGASRVQFAQPSPNPFSTRTRIQYVVPAGGAEVQLAVYDLSGRMIARLASGSWGAGVHDVTWDGKDSDGKSVRPSMYFLRGHVGTQQTAWRLMYVK